MNTTTISPADQNEIILQKRTALFNAISGPRVGDYLKLPYGLYTRFTHEWDNSFQTGGNSGNAYFLGEHCSYSGSLDSGVKKSDIVPTDEKKLGAVWFFNKDIAGPNRGIYYEIEFRVFELKPGANTSGLPQIAKYERQLIIDKAETVTRINGNGKPYTMPLPELKILVDHELSSVFMDHLTAQCGLTFEKCTGGYKAQPLTHIQLTTLLLSYNFSLKYYCNSDYNNTLFLTFNR